MVAFLRSLLGPTMAVFCPGQAAQKFLFRHWGGPMPKVGPQCPWDTWAVGTLGPWGGLWALGTFGLCGPV